MSNGSRFDLQSSAWRRAPTPTGSIADQIMDRIDSQIRGISTDPPARFAAPLPKTSLDGLFLSSLPTSTSNFANTNTRSAAHQPSSHANDDAASTSTMRLLQNFNPADLKLTDLESDLGTDLGEVVPTATSKLNIPTSDRSRNTMPEPDVDVSSVVAMQINEQYREVLSHKQTAMEYPYQSDNDTVRTEDFANKYRELQKAVAKMPDNGNPTMSDSAREVVDRANSIIDRYKHAHAEPGPANTLKTQAGEALTASGVMRNYSAAQNHQLGSKVALRLSGSNKFDRMNLSGNAQRSFKLLSPLTSGSQTPVDSQPTAVTLRKAEKSRQNIGSATTNSVHFATPFSRSDIKKESEIIKSEMELERRKKQLQELATRKDFSNIMPAKQPAATLSALPIQKEGDVARERLYTKLTELEELNTEIKHLRTDRDRVVEEVDRMNDLLKRQQEDIKTVERVTKTSKLRSDELKQETAILQTKRDSTMHELEQLNQELSGQRSKLMEMESTLNQRLQELRDYQSLGLSREEVQNIIAERNDLFQLVANIEEREMEKYELEKRLTVVEEDRLIEQEQFNERVADLEDEVQTRVTQVEDLMKENQDLKRSIESWKERLSDLQRDRELLHQDKVSEQERLRQQMQRDLSDIQKQSSDEIVALKTQVIDLRKHISQLEKEIDRRNSSINSVSNEKADIIEKMKRERGDMEQRVRDLELVKANEVKNLYDQLLKDRESALAEQEERSKAERQRTILKLEQKHAEEMQESAATLANAEKEILSLKEKILMLESNCDDLHAYYSKELDEKVQLVLDRERRKWTSELDAAGQSAQSEVMKVKLDREKVLQQMNEEMDFLKKTIGEKDNQLHRLDEELERQKEQYRVSLLEKQNELLQMKTEIRETCQSELSKIRDSMQKDSQSDKNKQKASLSEYRLRLEQTQLRLSALDEAQKTASHSHINLLRGIVEEVNANCQLLAAAIGVSPKFTNADNIQVGRDNKAVVKTALATLKACSEEVRQHLLELLRDSETLKVQLTSAQSSQGDEVAKVKVLLETQHTKEMDSLRDRLGKQYAEQVKQLALEHDRAMQTAIRNCETELVSLKSGLDGWKEDTAHKLASSIQHDLRSEYERKLRDLKTELHEKQLQLETTRTEVDRLSNLKIVTGSGLSGATEESATKLIAMLQERLKQLREQNIELHRMLSVKRLGASNTDLRMNLNETAPLSSVSHHAMSTSSSTVARYRERERERNAASASASRQRSPSPQRAPSPSLRPPSVSSNTGSIRDRNNLTRLIQQEASLEVTNVPPLNFDADINDPSGFERSKDRGLRSIEKNYEHIRAKLRSSQNRSGTASVASSVSTKPLNGHN